MSNEDNQIPVTTGHQIIINSGVTNIYHAPQPQQYQIIKPINLVQLNNGQTQQPQFIQLSPPVTTIQGTPIRIIPQKRENTDNRASIYLQNMARPQQQSVNTAQGPVYQQLSFQSMGNLQSMPSGQQYQIIQPIQGVGGVQLQNLQPVQVIQPLFTVGGQNQGFQGAQKQNVEQVRQDTHEKGCKN